MSVHGADCEANNCKKLFVAIILQAVADYNRPVPTAGDEGNARLFLFGSGVWKEHREWVCQHAGIDPKIITREAIVNRKFQMQRVGKTRRAPFTAEGWKGDEDGED